MACALRIQVLEYPIKDTQKENQMKQIQKKLLISLLIFTAVSLLGALGAFAGPAAGWNKEGNRIFYYMEEEAEDASGEIEARLVRAVGLHQIDGGYFYFRPDGTLSTGWTQTEQGVLFCMEQGGEGTVGRALTGLKRIDGRYYYFNKENGVMATGWTVVGRHTYFFTRKGGPGQYGSAIEKRWVKYRGSRYYFGKKGRLQTNRWVDGCYVDERGRRLTDTITPDGYQVGGNGRKLSSRKVQGWVKAGGKWYYYNGKKDKRYTGTFRTIRGNRYYFDETGARVKGWQDIRGNRYYFNSKGVMQKGETRIRSKVYYFDEKGRLKVSYRGADGLETDGNGVIIARPKPEETETETETQEPPQPKPDENGDGRPRVLIVAGHGQGDAGACSSLGQEYLKNREFAALIYSRLRKVSGLQVEYYQNGSTAYDMYQRNARALGSISSYAGGIKGNGALRSQVKSLLRYGKGCPNLWEYDYVLEVHFNATGYSAKDEGGNGTMKGFGIYINQNKSSSMQKIDRAMVRGIAGTGAQIWGRGSGLFGSATLLNARVCQELGVNYSLIETCFIDDRDDMNFYASHKKRMSRAIVSAISDTLL